MQQTTFFQDTWSGKTSQEPCPATGAKISGKSSRKSSASKKTALFLDLRSGGQAGVSWETDTAWHGEYWTPSFGECPSAAVESHLWQILQDNPPRKYFLSAEACMGILRRLKKRGKPVPELLIRALEWQSGGCGRTTVQMQEATEFREVQLQH